MTDLEKLKKVFNEIKQEYKVVERNEETFDSHVISIEHDTILIVWNTDDSVGYAGMYCEFYFLDGERVATGCWE